MAVGGAPGGVEEGLRQSGVSADWLAMDDSIADELFTRNLFFAKPADSVLGLKSSKDWDVFDPEMQVELFRCRESKTDVISKLAGKGAFDITLAAPSGPLLRVQTDPSFFTGGKGTLLFSDGKDRPLGVLKRRFLDLGFGNGYRFFAPGSSQALFDLKLKSKFRRYTIAIDGAPAAEVQLKWKGDHATYFGNGFKQAIVLLPGMPENPVARRVVIGMAFRVKQLMKSQ
jgi:hypothetical protein